MTQPDALFHVNGGVATPTELTRGPWSLHAQHGGAAAALLAGFLERHDPGPASFVVRLTVELLRPVPLAPLHVSVRPIRPGKKVYWLEGSLHADGVEVARATALRLREETLDVSAAVLGPVSSIPPPGQVSSFPPLRHDEVGFAHAIEASWVVGMPGGVGPTAAWLRLVVPVVAGEEPSPLQRVAAAADFGNGLSAAVSRERYSFINPDLTVTLHRAAVGEWIGLDAATYPSPTGIGVADSVLHDVDGRIGRGIQTLLIDPA
jgi:hypothetical protein